MTEDKSMLYRKLGKTPYNVSEIGVSCRGLIGHDLAGMNSAIDAMEEMGINFLDLYSPNPEFRHYMGHAVMNRRDKFIIQAHIGSIWEDSGYKYSRNITEVEKGFSDQLKTLSTGHVEIGLIHNIESPMDLDRVLNGDVMKFAERLKELGVIGAIGMSIHDGETALMAAKSGAVETIMFSANIFADYYHDHGGKKGVIAPARKEFYRYCEENGIGLTVMSVFKGGDLLHEDSPLGKPLDTNQCLSYALDNPGVASAICSALNAEELKTACSFSNLDEGERAKIRDSIKDLIE